MKKENTAIRLKTIMNMRGLRQVDILNLTVPYCQKYNVKMNKSDISQYCSGKTEPNQEKLFILGNALNVSEAWLMGFDVPMERTPYKAESVQNSSVSAQCKEIIEICNQLSPHNQRKVLAYSKNLLSAQQMEEDLRACSAYSNLERERLLWKQASLAADAINAFVDWLGFDPRHHSEQERTIIFRDKPVVLFPAVSDPVGEPLIGEVEAPYDRQWYTDWLRALMHGITANVDFDGQQIRNPQQNKRLYDILQAFKG